ncbi:MAG: pullulanase-type alpha-1,6-glucosidase [Thalassotalea sp.]
MTSRIHHKIMRHTLLLAFGFSLLGCNSETQNINDIQPLVSLKEIAISLKTTPDAAAHWLTHNVLVINKAESDSNNEAPALLQLISIQDEKLSAQAQRVINLTKTEFPTTLQKQFPHLAKFHAYHVNLDKAQAKLWLKDGIVVAQQQAGQQTKISFVQTSKVIDDLYTKGNNDADEETDLGATISLNDNGEKQVRFKLWAPTATKVNVILFDDKTKAEIATVALTEDKSTGMWSAQLSGDYHLAFYQYEVTAFQPSDEINITDITIAKEVIIRTTDPYSLSLSTNSIYSQVIDLNDPITMPAGWEQQQNITLINPEDAIIYETHIRDFSSAEQKLSNPAYRGKYKAFSEQSSDAINHIKALQKSGLNHIHLLPTFDLGTINENTDYQLSLNDNLDKVCQLAPTADLCSQALDSQLTLKQLLTSFDPISANAQAVVSELRTKDNYNWGYDPFHYTVPEGSYAVNPEGEHRIIEFREMVQSLHNMGFRVIMDVVYNHTHQAGLARTSVLDKIVPNYYQRLNPFSGQIEQSTCCDNTATENVMMEKLMIDSLVTWAQYYKIDGFRFDLMGHQPKTAMIKAREAVRQIDPDTYFYGEGWNFGEVANNQQFIQASQLELAGTEIGTYTDRLRDAVRGPSFNVSGFDHRKNQGLGNGLGTFNNEMQNSDDNRQYLLLMDQLRIGLTGNLANFPLKNSHGSLVLGKEIPYGDQPAGYALDPADTINYVSKHDNQTLWDNSQYRTAYQATTAQRVRMHNQSLSYAILAQGIPFLHMGSELLRSKSFLRDSYDYGDWFNFVDYSMTSNNYHVGLPPAEKDQANWPLIKALLEKNQGRDQVSAIEIKFAAEVFKSFLAIRTSSPLFRLTSAQQIIDKISFLNSGKDSQVGLIAMLIDDNKGLAVDENYQQLLVIFNSSPEPQNFINNKLAGFSLHPLQKNGADATVKTSTINSKKGIVTATIPAFTTAVFVKK